METKTDTSQEPTAPEAAPQASVSEMPAQEASQEAAHPQTRKERVGVVVSDKMDKTIVVAIERRQQHPMYDKYLRRTSRLMAHDEHDDANEGDAVRLMGTRPLSKHKRWRLAEIIERAK